ncbi:unnamed protein product [Durusdinium trenchii]|uniref:Centrosomal protein of 120 kDa n=2 Tax=Durusdinium trenchii TaxID=1381693 RepID=A0ABP0LZ50_9DINO
MAIGSRSDAVDASDLDLKELALEGLKVLRASPAYAVARSLELWRQQEEDRACTRLQEKERELRERLEDEYRQRELLRAQSFRQQQSELRDLEQRAKKKLMEMQHREQAVKASLAKAKSLSEESRRSADLAIQSCEDTMRRHKAEARQSLEFEQMRQSQLETRLKELEAEMAETRARCSDLQSCLNQKAIANAELDRHDTAGSAADEEELRKLQLQLCEEKVKSETLAASRDHFRRKVEELCKKLLEKTDVPKHGADQTRPAHQSKASPQCTLETEVQSPHFSLDWLQQQKRELLESGLYTQEDAVIRALDAQIAEQAVR